MFVKPVMLDVDTGFDDALALLLALRSPLLDVRAITCVAGNQRLPQVVVNTLKVLDVAGAGEIPVAAGMERALLEPLRTPMALHGADGMADLSLPEPVRRPASVHAVELMRRTLADADVPLSLIALGPLTNVAVLLRMYPQAAAKLDAILVMGGACTGPGNTSAVTEFNIHCDPEAAAIVLESGLPITLYTLDVFMQVGFTHREIDAFCASDDPAARMAGDILRFSCAHFQTDSALIGDAGVVALALEPEIGRLARYPIVVERAGTRTRGQTVIDRRPAADIARLVEWSQAAPAEVWVTDAIDVEACRTVFAGGLGVVLERC